MKKISAKRFGLNINKGKTKYLDMRELEGRDLVSLFEKYKVFKRITTTDIETIDFQNIKNTIISNGNTTQTQITVRDCLLDNK